MSKDELINNPDNQDKELDNLLDSFNRCMDCNIKHSERTKENCCDFCRPKPKYPNIAPEGTIFVCGACGKTHKCKYGDIGSSWDESCMLNAVLCEENSFKDTGTWKAVTDYD